MTNIGIVEACWPQDPDRVLALFRAYIDGLGIDLSFQGVYRGVGFVAGKIRPTRRDWFSWRAARKAVW